ncbi:hypothetical protein [Undibacterium griseum]|uniref:Uncharacterized protein n=1 Tax=Undibacterium griseum TaxID=2762295 RepID=A0ABR6YN17_9BURK|nr:hypothetical protein [Undibacterium griseum]MBC3885278.1 hypothetical protein [Undibacterium griseum]
MFTMMLSRVWSRLRGLGLGVLLCGVAGASPVHAAEPERLQLPLTELQFNQPFTISAPGLCQRIAAAQPGAVELRIQGVLTPYKPFDCRPGTPQDVLGYRLPALDSDSQADLREVWLGSPWRDAKAGFQRTVSYHLSLNLNGSPQELGSGMFRLQVLHPVQMLLGCGCICLVGFALLRLGRDSGLLRDLTHLSIQRRSFSLSRVQMAWWFFIVFAAYLWLWIVGEGIPALSAQALGLMGIGSATYLTAAGVDASKPLLETESAGFWRDILSDTQGLALYRFQMLVLNILFGLLFVIYVVQHVRMPELDSNILTLLGMSAGTYAGFKIPEKQTMTTTQATPGALAADDPKAGYAAAPLSTQ